MWVVEPELTEVNCFWDDGQMTDKMIEDMLGPGEAGKILISLLKHPPRPVRNVFFKKKTISTYASIL